MDSQANYNGSRQQARYLELLQRRFGLEAPPEPGEHFRALRGHQLHLDVHSPRGTPRGTVLLLHGAGAHGRLLAPFARPCVAQGFEVWAPDLPGYGLTRPAQPVTHYEEWIELVVDLCNEAAERGPVVLFGLSVGGLTALRAAQRAHQVAGVIATTLIDVRDPSTFIRVARSPILGRASRWLFAHMPAALGRIRLRLGWVAPIEKLTRDPMLARLLREDPLIGRNAVSLGFLRSLHLHAESAPNYDLPCPLLLVHPGADDWTPLALSEPLFDAIATPKQRVVLSNGSHAPLEQPAYGELCAAVENFLHERSQERSTTQQSLATSARR